MYTWSKPSRQSLSSASGTVSTGVPALRRASMTRLDVNALRISVSGKARLYSFSTRSMVFSICDSSEEP